MTVFLDTVVPKTHPLTASVKRWIHQLNGPGPGPLHEEEESTRSPALARCRRWSYDSAYATCWLVTSRARATALPGRNTGESGPAPPPLRLGQTFRERTYLVDQPFN